MGAPPDWGDQVAHSGFVPCRLDALPACVLWQLSMVSPSSGALFLTWGAGLPFFPVSLIKLACASILRHFCGVPYPPAEAEPIPCHPAQLALLHGLLTVPPVFQLEFSVSVSLSLS